VLGLVPSTQPTNSEIASWLAFHNPKSKIQNGIPLSRTSMAPGNKKIMETLKFLIATRLKQAKRAEPTSSGFTLIEILVALIIAVLVITPLLGLAVNLLNTDRQEAAKATSEQELQAAADFIARDLQQAVFIYDPVALTTQSPNGIQTQIPPSSSLGTGSDCTAATNCVPVLAFWKRRPVKEAVPINGGLIGCGPNDAGRNTRCNDTFVYSLVTYYWIKDTSNTNVWSNTARIGRFEIKDGVRALNGQPIPTRPASDGFALFNLKLSAPNLAGKMNRWIRGAGAYSANDMQILVDYIDQTPTNPTTSPLVACPASPPGWSPTSFPSTTSPGFYACVNQSANIARVFIRGNALARIRPGNTPPTYTQSQSSYFPSVSAEVRAVGKLVQ
jgi:prepilin-type N-terminal cleavage/methylation domain-containing protein